jgi:hypothetical protein
MPVATRVARAEASRSSFPLVGAFVRPFLRTVAFVLHIRRNVIDGPGAAGAWSFVRASNRQAFGNADRYTVVSEIMTVKEAEDAMPGLITRKRVHAPIPDLRHSSSSERVEAFTDIPHLAAQTGVSEDRLRSDLESGRIAGVHLGDEWLSNVSAVRSVYRR